MELKFYQQNKIKLENAILFSSDEIITTFQSIQKKKKFFLRGGGFVFL